MPLRNRNKNTMSAYRLGGGGFDPDAQAFIDAAGITGETQQSALNQLVLDLKGSGSTTNNSNVWSDLITFYPFCPIDDSTANENTYKLNLKDPRDLDAAYRLQFFNTPIYDATNGLSQNGSINAYANTFIIINNISQFNTGVSYRYNNEVNVGNSDYPWAVNDLNTTGARLRLINNQLIHYYNETSSNITVSPSNNRYTINRVDDSTSNLYSNASIEGTDNTTVTTAPTLPIFLLCRNNGGSANSFSNLDLSYWAFHNTLSLNQIKDLDDSISNYLTAINR